MSEQLLHQILQKLDHIETEQYDMKSDIQSMKSDMQSMKSEMQSMGSEMQSMKSDIQGLKGTQGLMQTQLSETHAIVRAISDRQDVTDAKLDALSMDMNKRHGEQNSIREEQARHEKILEKLCLRSIEQETDISAIRRAL
ncbi:hypothetical protein V3851_19670 [Paenibacillus sp. M1]|uniref:Uncharacterized protein n=1 Tax=Paenibacillus haidiansis TaxID=1574488 RepID=A0ABU7VWH2_9BACL